MWADQEVFPWDRCVQQAQANNPGLISSAENIQIKRWAVDITASALYPQVGVVFTAGTAGASSESDDGTTDSYAYGADASLLLFDGFQTINDIRGFEQDVDAARQSYRFVSSQVLYNLRAAFINLLKAQELRQVTSEIMAIRKESLVLIALKYEAGLEHKGALLTAEANAASARFDFLSAERAGVVAQRQLLKEMGETEYRDIYVEGELDPMQPDKQTPDFEQIAQNVPDVLEARANKNGALFGVRSAKGAFVPVVSGISGAGRRSSRWPPEEDRWSAGLTASLGLFEGGRKTAQLAQAESFYSQAIADERSVLDEAVVALAEAWTDWQNASDAVGVAAMTLEAYEERSKIAQAQYSTGFITFDNWIIIQDDLVRAKKVLLEARAVALLTQARWMREKGVTLDYGQT